MPQATYEIKDQIIAKQMGPAKQPTDIARPRGVERSGPLFRENPSDGGTRE